MALSLDRCNDYFEESPTFLGRGYGRWVGSSIFLGLAITTVIFLIIQRRIGASVVTSNNTARGHLSAIFPAFETFLYILVAVDIYTGLLILGTRYRMGEKWSTPSFLFIGAVAVQHVVSEGIAFLLMQKGCGYYAFKRASKYALLWGLITYAMYIFVYFQNPRASEVFISWNGLLLLFYVSLWFTPMNCLYRRPAAVLFAKIFSLYQGILFAFIIYEEYFTDNSVACVSFFNFLFVKPLFQPVFAYYILLEDCRWWQGIGRHGVESTLSTMSPLHGFDVSLQSATALASIVDHMGGASATNLISFSQISYDKNDLLGYGSFSKVYKGVYKNKQCAIKLVYTMDLTEEDILRVAAEATILSSVKSINVVNIYGVTVMPPSVCVVLELCRYGSLSDILRPPKALTLSFQDKIFLCLGCAKGVATLHSINPSVVHRDIKSFNFLVDHQLHAKLADLELGAFGDSSFDIKNIDDNSLFHSDFLANWIAPEVLSHAPYTQASDIYSLSLVFWEIFSKEIPFSQENNLSTRSAILNKLRPDLKHPGFQNCPQVMQNLIISGWSEDPLVRPAAVDFVSVLESIIQAYNIEECSVLEAKSGKIIEKVSAAEASLELHDDRKSECGKPTTYGNNLRLMAIVPLFNAFEAIENDTFWQEIRRSPESIMITTGQHPFMFLQCSLEWENITGYLNENLFGYCVRDLLWKNSSSEANDSVSNDIYEDFLSNLRQSKSSGHCVVDIHTSSNTRVTISLHAVPIFNSQYERSFSVDGTKSKTAWSGAVPYARSIAFYKMTATELTRIEQDDVSESGEKSSVFSRLMQRLSSVGNGSSLYSFTLSSKHMSSGSSGSLQRSTGGNSMRALSKSSVKSTCNDLSDNLSPRTSAVEMLNTMP